MAAEIQHFAIEVKKLRYGYGHKVQEAQDDSDSFWEVPLLRLQGRSNYTIIW